MTLTLPTQRYRLRERYVPRHGPHRLHLVEVVHVTPGQTHDLVRALCECGTHWRFLHHHARWT